MYLCSIICDHRHDPLIKFQAPFSKRDFENQLRFFKPHPPRSFGRDIEDQKLRENFSYPTISLRDISRRVV